MAAVPAFVSVGLLVLGIREPAAVPSVAGAPRPRVWTGINCGRFGAAARFLAGAGFAFLRQETGEQPCLLGLGDQLSEVDRPLVLALADPFDQGPHVGEVGVRGAFNLRGFQGAPEAGVLNDSAEDLGPVREPAVDSGRLRSTRLVPRPDQGPESGQDSRPTPEEQRRLQTHLEGPVFRPLDAQEEFGEQRSATHVWRDRGPVAGQEDDGGFPADELLGLPEDSALEVAIGQEQLQGPAGDVVADVVEDEDRQPAHDRGQEALVHFLVSLGPCGGRGVAENRHRADLRQEGLAGAFTVGQVDERRRKRERGQ
ncbi:MAG: hypothetical protein JNK85_10190 [Verrucomicrobiales bacterium]|nr:hypothetical protein [Verrucomicrobiales bacterium]